MKSMAVTVVMCCATTLITACAVLHYIRGPAICVRDELKPQIAQQGMILAGVKSRIAQDEAVVADLMLAPPFPQLQAVSVKVDLGYGCGTGVLVTRQIGPVTRTFVWTAGHVVMSLRNDDGTFRNVKITQEQRVNGKYQKTISTDAKVIAYSDPEAGDDLALLEILKDNFAPLDVSADFVLGDAAPAIGTELVHVGCTLGLYDSTSRGIISQTDRNILETGKMFDQTSCMGYPGSSGGGVYLARGGKCVGLLVRGAGAGLNFIVPSRRMLVWAKKMNVEWALNRDCAVPTHVVRDTNPLTDGTEPKLEAIPPLPDGALEPAEPGSARRVIDAIIDAIRSVVRVISGHSTVYPLPA